MTLSPHNQAVLDARAAHRLASLNEMYAMCREAAQRAVPTNLVKHRPQGHVMPEPRHEYKGSPIHHPKWWGFAASETYDRLFLDRKGRDMRDHRDWGRRSLTSVRSTLFGRA